MTDNYDNNTASRDSGLETEQSNWGAKLFVGTLILVLVFFWWLFVYSGGVAGHGG